MLSEGAWAELGRSLELSGRELQMVCAVFDGRKESEIAGELGISPHTVHTYFERLHRKLAVSGRAGVVLRVMQECLAAGGESGRNGVANQGAVP
jgi:DNA-binding CsgD family transcriptional regulator